MHDRALFDFPQRDTRPAIQIALSLRSISTNITSSSLMSQVALPMAQKLANVTTSVSKKELNIARGPGRRPRMNNARVKLAELSPGRPESFLASPEKK